MGTTIYIVLGVIVAFVVLIIYNYKKINNMPVTPDHENIKILNKNNFKTQVNSGLVMVDFWAPCISVA